MRWIILFAALLIVFLLYAKSRRSSGSSAPEPIPGDRLEKRMEAAARIADSKGFSRLRKTRRWLGRLEKPLLFLNALVQEECLPATRILRENGRFLQQTALNAQLAWKAAPPLPSARTREARIRLFARALLSYEVEALTEKSLDTAVKSWQAIAPMTEDELAYLQTALQTGLLERLTTLSETCAQNQRARLAARRMLQLAQHSRSRQAEKRFQAYGHHDSFLECLLSLDPGNALLQPLLSGQQAEALIRREHLHQTELALQAERAMASLRLLDHLPWKRLLERWSRMDRQYRSDPVYCAMDDESRRFYRRRTAWIARRAQADEEAVASAVCALCKADQDDPLLSHVGYYLLDDGLPRLVGQLHRSSLALRLWMLSMLHASAIRRIASWAVFAALLGIGYVLRLPLAAVWLGSIVFAGAFHSLLCRLRASVFLPCMDVERLDENTRTLAVCPVVLTSASQAIQAVKRLLIMHEAHRDENLHFLLLADFQDSLTATLTSDAEIISAASAAVKALCEETGHPFFYMQRERRYFPAEKRHQGRERRRGMVQTLLRLITRQTVQDSFAFSTVNLDWFYDRYRYVILLDEEVSLLPGSVQKMAGAMLHPLAMRQKRDHRMRGFSMLKPAARTVRHSLRTPFAALTADAMRPEAGAAIVDPRPFLEATERGIAEGFLLSADRLERELAGCATGKNIVVCQAAIQTAGEWLAALHRRVRACCQQLPYVLPLFPAHRRPAQQKLGLDGRSSLWTAFLSCLLSPLRLLLLACAAGSGRWRLWLCLMLIPELGRLSHFSFKRLLGQLAFFPLEAVISADALIRALYRLVISHQQLLKWDALPHGQEQSPMFASAVLLGNAAVFALLLLLPASCWLCCLLCAAGWAACALVLPFLNQERIRPFRPTRYMQEVLRRLARNTLTFFEVAITEADHALPTASVQIDPNTGIAHRTSPDAVGLYLCALLSAQKLRLLPAQEMADRMQQTLSTLESLPRWHGLFHHSYDTRTLLPEKPRFLSSEACGTLVVCLLCCAQGVRALLPELREDQAALAARMDALARSMPLEKLFDPEAERFYTGYDCETDQPSGAHHDLLGSEARLLSYAAIMLGKAPLVHWRRLSRQTVRCGALLSQNGSMAEYLTPLLFQPLIRRTLLHQSTLAAVRRQQRHKLGGAYGVSRSLCHAFDPDLHYQQQAFGLPQLALNAEVHSDVLAPYACMLSLPLTPKRAFRSLLKMQVMGLEGPLGLFEAADFDPVRTDGQRMRIVRSHTARHQAMILCGICNLLEGNHLAELFSKLPRAQAYRHLLEEEPPRRRSQSGRLLAGLKATPPLPADLMQRRAQPLHFPMDAHLLSGGGTLWLINAQGGGFLSHQGRMQTRFNPCCTHPDGLRIYLRDSQSGACWLATDPYLMQSVRFESAQAVFQHTRLELHSELRMWVDPLSSSAIHCLTLENSSAADRLMEVCSYLEPASSECVMRRSGPCGIAAASAQQDAAAVSLTHWLLTEARPHALRLQNNRAAFWGCSYGFGTPESLEKPIAAFTDSLGETDDPCISLRGQFTLRAKSKSVFCFVTHPGAKDERTVSLSERLADPAAIAGTYEAAQTRGMVTARFAGLSPAEEAEVSRMTGALCYTGQPAQGGRNPLPLSTLQELGIHPHQPLLVLECKGSVNKPLVHLLCKAYTFYHLSGFAIEWAIVIQSHARASALLAEVESELASIRCLPHEGIRLIMQPDREKLMLLRACARLCLHGSASLGDQLAALSQSVHARPVYACRVDDRWPSALPPVEDCVFANPFGGFTPQEGSCLIQPAPGARTPFPWKNLLCSKTFGTLADESGALTSSNDTKEAFFLRDEENRLLWSPMQRPLGQNVPVRTIHSPGETVYESSANGVHTRLLCASDEEWPMALRSIQLKNEDAQPRRLTLFHVCFWPEWAQLEGGSGEVSGYIPERDEYAGLYAVDPAQCACAAMSIGLFQGLGQEAPYALSTLETLPSEMGGTAILAFDVSLAGGESCTLTTAMGSSHEAAVLQQALSAVRAEGISHRLHAARERWQSRVGNLQFDLPDPAFSLMLGKWLPCQLHAAALWHGEENLPTVLPPLLYIPSETAVQAWLSHAESRLKNSTVSEVLPGLLLLFSLAAHAEAAFPAERSLAFVENIPLGAHGLPIVRNDQAEEESTFAAMLLCETLRRLSALCKEAAETLLQRREALLGVIDRFCWDGGWYLRGFGSDGSRLGSSENKETPDVLTQAWAVLCGVSRDRCEAAVENAWRVLPKCGRLGSQPFGFSPCAIASWLICALHQLGQEERAWLLAASMLPISTVETILPLPRLRREPYSVDGFFHPDPKSCLGTACYWEAVVCQLLGLRRQGNALRFVPVAPQAWDRLRITYRFRSATYHLHAVRSCVQPTADGQPLENGWLTLMDDGRIHEAFFPLR